MILNNPAPWPNPLYLESLIMLCVFLIQLAIIMQHVDFNKVLEPPRCGVKIPYKFRCLGVTRNIRVGIEIRRA